MAFEDLGNWAELAGLRLPIGGKTYVLPPVSAELGLRIVAIMELGTDLSQGKAPNAADQVLLSDDDERALYQEILGPVFDQMVADGVPWAALKHSAMTAMIDVSMNRSASEIFWARLGKTTPAKKPAKKPADRLPRKATASKTSTASTAGTTAPRRARKTAAARPGRKSSPSGG